MQEFNLELVEHVDNSMLLCSIFLNHGSLEGHNMFFSHRINVWQYVLPTFRW